jgi:hypothetical protein
VTARDFSKATLAYLFLLFVFHGALLWGGDLLVGGDMLNHFLPMWHVALAQDAWHWHPLTFSGRPLLADPQMAMLYPGNWLLRAGGVEALPRLMTVLQMAHLLGAGLGMFALLRTRFPLLPALLGGGLWMCGAPSLLKMHAGIKVFVEAQAWLPLLLLAADWAGEDGRRLRGLGLAGIAGGAQLLAGAAQVSQISWMAAGIWWLARTLAEHRGAVLGKALARGGAVLAGGVALAVLIALPQLLATAEFLKASYPRGTEDRWAYVTADSLRWMHVVTWIAPHLFGPGADDSLYFGSSTGFHETCMFMGAATLLLAGAGFAVRAAGAPWKAPAAALGVFGIAMALGSASPLFRLFFEFVPTFDSLRVPARWGVLAALTLVFAAAHGIEAILREDVLGETRRRWLAGAGVALVPLLAVAALSAPVGRAAGLEESLWLVPPNAVEETIADRYAAARRAAQGALALAALAGAAGALRLSGRLAVKPTLVILALVLLLDLRGFWQPFRRAYPIDVPPQEVPTEGVFHRLADASRIGDLVSRETDAIRAIRDATEDGGRVLVMEDVFAWDADEYARELFAERMTWHGIANVRGYQQLALKGYVEEISAVSRANRPGDTFSAFLRLPTLDSREPLDRYNVAAVLTYHRLQPPQAFEALGLEKAGVVNPQGLTLWRNPHARGRVWLSAEPRGPRPQAPLGEATLALASADREEISATVTAQGAWLNVSAPADERWQLAVTPVPPGLKSEGGRSVFLPRGEYRITRRCTSSTGGLAGGTASAAALLAALAALAGGFRRARIPADTIERPDHE